MNTLQQRLLAGATELGLLTMVVTGFLFMVKKRVQISSFLIANEEWLGLVGFAQVVLAVLLFIRIHKLESRQSESHDRLREVGKLTNWIAENCKDWKLSFLRTATYVDVLIVVDSADEYDDISTQLDQLPEQAMPRYDRKRVLETLRDMSEWNSRTQRLGPTVPNDCGVRPLYVIVRVSELQKIGLSTGQLFANEPFGEPLLTLLEQREVLEPQTKAETATATD